MSPNDHGSVRIPVVLEPAELDPVLLLAKQVCDMWAERPFRKHEFSRAVLRLHNALTTMDLREAYVFRTGLHYHQPGNVACFQDHPR